MRKLQVFPAGVFVTMRKSQPSRERFRNALCRAGITKQD
jgi:hypothetical protein